MSSVSSEVQGVIYRDIYDARVLLVTLRELMGKLNAHDRNRRCFGEVRMVLENSVVDALVMTLGRVFDVLPGRDVVHLKRLVQEAAKARPKSVVARRAKEFLSKIDDVRRRLDPLRNTARAHNKPGKVDSYPPRTMKMIYEWVDLAEEIFRVATESLGDSWGPVSDQIGRSGLASECDQLLQCIKGEMER